MPITRGRAATRSTSTTRAMSGGAGLSRSRSRESRTSSIEELQARLEAEADAGKKAWWEKYLKHVIVFRGVPMAKIRKEVEGWLPAEGRVELAVSLLREPVADDKLAGILVLAEHVVPSGEPAGVELLPVLAPLFSEGHVADWNTCDWLCVKVLHRLLERDGEPFAAALLEWKRADVLWQRRAAVVPFVNLAAKADAQWPGMVDALLDACAEVATDPERFAQTAVGWVLRELSKTHPDRVRRFVRDRSDLSKEAQRMALAKITGGPRR